MKQQLLELNTRASALIKKFEGCMLTAYQDGAGIWTIGWGDTRAVTSGQTISQEEADRRLTERVGNLSMAIDLAAQDHLTANELAALTSFAYNLGLTRLLGSTLWHLVEEGQIHAAAGEFLKWNKLRNPQTGQLEPCQGLTNRRMAERELFLKVDATNE